MCERWESSFENFLADMGQAPSGTSLDRYPNQDGNYEHGNCRWATKKEQQRNMRSNRIVEYGGRSQPVSAWAEETGIHKDTLIYRIDTDWPIERLFSPATRTGRNVK